MLIAVVELFETLDDPFRVSPGEALFLRKNRQILLP